MHTIGSIPHRGQRQAKPVRDPWKPRCASPGCATAGPSNSSDSQCKGPRVVLKLLDQVSDRARTAGHVLCRPKRAFCRHRSTNPLCIVSEKRTESPRGQISPKASFVSEKRKKALCGRHVYTHRRSVR